MPTGHSDAASQEQTQVETTGDAGVNGNTSKKKRQKHKDSAGKCVVVSAPGIAAPLLHAGSDPMHVKSVCIQAWM